MNGARVVGLCISHHGLVLHVVLYSAKNTSQGLDKCS